MTISLAIADIEAARSERPAAYIEAILGAGQIVGQELHIDEDTLQAIRDQHLVQPVLDQHLGRLLPAGSPIVEERRAICRQCERFVGGVCDLLGCLCKLHYADVACPDTQPKWISAGA